MNIHNGSIASFCGISLHSGDKLRLLNFPPELFEPFCGALTKSWGRGIQDRRSYGGLPEIKLFGYPWYGQGDEAVPSRVLVTSIFAFMYRQGWGATLVTDLSKKGGDKDSIFFKKLIPDLRSQFCAISFNRTDRIRIIGAPAELESAVLLCVRSAWQRGIQEERTYHGARELKLRGNPWLASGTQTTDARMLLLHLMATLENAGWTVYASIDISAASGEDSGLGDLDTWILKSVHS